MRITCASVKYDHREKEMLMKTMNPFWLSSGKYVREFEAGMRSFLKATHCIACNSGSSANLLAIASLTSQLLGDRRLVKGDEVITTALCFPTTIAPIIQYGLVPVFVDVDTSLGMNIAELRKAITRKTKAIVVAHTLGFPADMDAITKIAKKHNLWVIEDNCDALGATTGGKYTGTIGDIGTVSFYPAHHITTGEGGLVITNNETINKAVRSLRDWGRDCVCDTGKDNFCGKRHSLKFGELPLGYDHKYVFSHVGYNLKMTDLQAAIGCAQIKKLPSFLKKRHSNWESITGMKLPKGSSPFGVLYHSANRREVIEYLESNDIQTRMVFAGNITKQPMMIGQVYKISGKLTTTDFIMNNVFWVGCHPNISKSQILKLRFHIKETKAKLFIQ